jgi:two-component SAPR family response regulator
MLGFRSVANTVRRVIPANASFREPPQGFQTPSLSGVRILLVEDETLVALHLAEMVREFGGTVVKIVSSIDRALEAINGNDVDSAILDVNLGGTLSFSLGALLRRKNIPFVYCTAYLDAASVFPPVAAAPRLGKPVRKEDLRDALLHVLHAQRA